MRTCDFVRLKGGGLKEVIFLIWVIKMERDTSFYCSHISKGEMELIFSTTLPKILTLRLFKGGDGTDKGDRCNIHFLGFNY